MKEILNYLFEHKTLSKDKAREVLKDIASGKYSESEMAAFLAVFGMRPVTVDELSGFMEVLQELCVRVDLGDIQAIDLCGTGGDGKHTFNISTLASFVVAGAGIPVAKHGNYGVSSGCGSSNVLEALGHKFTNDPAVLKATIQRSGICFMHAPLFHPAMKHVAPVRRAMGVKTFFNMLGPLINPSFPSSQITGVYGKDVVRLYKYVLQQTNRKFIILYSLDGYDEISLTSPFMMVTNTGERVVTPEELGFPTYTHNDIAGGETVPEAVATFRSILEGRGTKAQNDVVVVNAAVGIYCAKPELSLSDCIAQARESLSSGKALNVLNLLLQ